MFPLNLPNALTLLRILAVPVVDEDEHLVGIVTVDDAIDTILPGAWKRRLPRLFARERRAETAEPR